MCQAVAQSGRCRSWSGVREPSERKSKGSIGGDERTEENMLARGADKELEARQCQCEYHNNDDDGRREETTQRPRVEKRGGQASQKKPSPAPAN